MILDAILRNKGREVELEKSRYPIDEVKKNCRKMPPCRDFTGALRASQPAIIAEIKKASPSRGVLREEFDPAGLAIRYTKAGAAALSVVTDEKFFSGHPRHLIMAKNASSLPLLRKDFIVDEYQIWASRFLGADALLLIVRVLGYQKLKEFLELASFLGMTALTEVHSEEELDVALGAGAEVIGINNRDLDTFEVDLGTTLKLLPFLPKGCTVVSKSGICTGQEIKLLQQKGVQAFLIGEALLQAEDIEGKMAELIGKGGEILGEDQDLRNTQS